jgi:hypothetical protein
MRERTRSTLASICPGNVAENSRVFGPRRRVRSAPEEEGGEEGEEDANKINNRSSSISRSNAFPSNRSASSRTRNRNPSSIPRIADA